MGDAYMITNHGRINTETRLFGVIGNPVVHSLGPLVHNLAFELTGINAVYLAFETRDVEKVIHGMQGLSIGGLSVTIPSKIAIMDYLDEIHPMAKKIGAVNTVVNRGGRISGYNTDCEGAMDALGKVVSVKGKRVGIIGAGGAARAIGFGVQEKGGETLIFNRSPEPGRNLASAIGGVYHPLSDIRSRVCDILVNTTPVGMYPETGNSPVQKDALKKDMVVMDIVYNPLETRLLSLAKDMGCTVVDGLLMFIFQAAKQFELFTGQTAPVSAMEKAAREHLLAGSRTP